MNCYRFRHNGAIRNITNYKQIVASHLGKSFCRIWTNRLVVFGQTVWRIRECCFVTNIFGFLRGGLTGF